LRNKVIKYKGQEFIVDKAKSFFAILWLGITIGVVVVVILIFLIRATPKSIIIGGVEFEIPTSTAISTSTFEATSTAFLQAQPSQIPSNSLEASTVISEPIVVSISAKKGWQATGITIKVGDTVRIRHKEGLWQSTENEILFGPDPHLTSEPIDKCFPLSSDPGALIGMTGNYEPFKIGYSYETISSVQGELFLRMNDCDHWLYNNRDEFEGGIKVIVSVITKP
jgi:hypothetical protein